MHNLPCNDYAANIPVQSGRFVTTPPIADIMLTRAFAIHVISSSYRYVFPERTFVVKNVELRAVKAGSNSADRYPTSFDRSLMFYGILTAAIIPSPLQLNTPSTLILSCLADKALSTSEEIAQLEIQPDNAATAYVSTPIWPSSPNSFHSPGGSLYT